MAAGIPENALLSNFSADSILGRIGKAVNQSWGMIFLLILFLYTDPA